MYIFLGKVFENLFGQRVFDQVSGVFLKTLTMLMLLIESCSSLV
jgi:hypothetical protein